MLVLARFHASVGESPSVFSYCVSITTIGIRGVVSKTTTTTQFDVEKFDGKSKFLLWKMRVTSLLVKKGTHKALLGIEKKSSKMEDDE